jgi:hypothetical protein
LESAEGLVSTKDVFQSAGHHVVNPWSTIGRGWAFKKSKGLCSFSVGDGFFENLVFFPILKDRLPNVWVVYLLKFLVRFHCVYSGELEEKNELSLSRSTLVGSSIALKARHLAQNKAQR